MSLTATTTARADSPSYGRQVRVRVLGPLEVGDPDTWQPVPGTMRRRLLALLSTRPGHELTVDELVEGLWGDNATSSSVATLQSHVARLRQDLPDPSMVQTGSSGYRLAVAPDLVDAVAFGHGVIRGRRALDAKDAVTASEELAAALSWWRGPAYSDFPGCRPLETEAARLEALRVDAVEWLITAELQRGDITPPVATLEAFVGDHPTRESAWALLVRALYRSGRQADALAAFRRARDHLRDELGIEPGRELRELEAQVLRQDPALDPTPDRDDDPPPPVVTPPRPQMGMAERRTITVVAIAVERSRVTDPEDRDLADLDVNPLIDELSATYAGSVRLGVDGTPVVLLGFPVAHEDDPERGVRLALELVDRLGVQGRSASAGVATGDVVSRPGSEHPVSGRPLVTAADHSHTAGVGHVVLDVATADRVSGLADLVEQADGLWRAVGFRVAHPVPRTLSNTPLVGRSRDLASLRAVLDQTIGDRRTHLVTIVADAGTGKSRLVAEFAHGLGESVVWRTGRCRPYGDGVAFSALTEVLRQHAGIDDSDDPEVAAARLHAMLPPDEADELARYLGPLLFAGAEGTPARATSFAAWRRALQLMATEQAAVLLIEDLHWASIGLLDFLDELASDPQDVPLLVVATARPELFAARPGWGAGASPSVTLRLSPLTRDETLELLGHVSDLDDEDREVLARRCSGNPLYAEELARLASQSTGEVDVGTTPALSGVIQARLDTLSDVERSVLGAAAVAGNRIWVSQVAEIAQRSAEEVAVHLESLARREFLRRRSVSSRQGDPELMFVHELVQEVAYGRLLRSDRSRHHLRAARWWRSDDDRGLETHADVIAHHELLAYDLATASRDGATTVEARPLAAASSFVAGRLVHGLDTRAAVLLLGRAVELAEPGTVDYAHALMWHAASLLDDRQFVVGEEEMGAAFRLLEELDDPLRVDASMLWFNFLFTMGRPFEPALAAIERAISTLPPSRALVRALSTRGMVQLMGQTPESMRAAIVTADDAIAMASALGCGGDAFSHVIRGRARVGLGDETGLDELEHYLGDLSFYETGTINVGARQWWAGALHHWRGPVAEWQAREELETVVEARGLFVVRSMSVAEEVRVLWELGRLREAIALADTVDLTVDAQPRWAVVQRALALIDLGELDQATIDAVRRTPPADERDLRHVVGAAAVLMTEALGRGDEVDVRARLDELGDLQALVERDGAVELMPRVVGLAIRAGCADLVAGIHGIDSESTPLRRIIAVHVSGLLAVGEGRRGEAVTLLTRAADEWLAFGNASEAAAARRDLLELAV